MTDETDIVNWALQRIGTRTTVTSAELANNSSNEAIQANLVLEKLRDELMRMAPWNCGTNTANLTYITSQPGTPENTSAGTVLWEKGQPSPPWVYEYQYPVDCLRPLWVVPQWNTGFAAGVPITTAVTGGAAAWWNAPPQKFKVGIDQFYPVTAAAVDNGGTGFNVGDIVLCAQAAQGDPPVGAPVALLVTAAPGGVISAVSVINQVSGQASGSPLGGSYFAVQTNPVAMASVIGVGGNPSNGTGATFDLTFGPQVDQRVILTNQEFAILVYMRQVSNVNVMDPQFQDAWSAILASRLVFALSGDKALANMKIAEANAIIVEARKADGNEGLTINDVTPDFIRVRGIDFAADYSWGGPYNGFDWGSTFPLY